MLSEQGRGLYLRVIGGLAPAGLTVLELAGAGPVDVGSEVTAS